MRTAAQEAPRWRARFFLSIDSFFRPSPLALRSNLV
jgi:hypothetical protein